MNFIGETKYAGRAFSAGSGDKVAFGGVIRGVIGNRESRKTFPVRETFCVQRLCLRCDKMP